LPILPFGQTPEANFCQFCLSGNRPKPIFFNFAFRAIAQTQFFSILPFGQTPKPNFFQFCLSGRRPKPTFDDFAFRADAQSQIFALAIFLSVQKILFVVFYVAIYARKMYNYAKLPQKLWRLDNGKD